MRIKLAGNVHDQETIAEPFSIDGSSETFAVHRALDADVEAGKEPWAATHVETGFLIARGDSIDAAISNARQVWLSKSPEDIQEAKARAELVRGARDALYAFS
jgi:hypothetical protein